MTAEASFSDISAYKSAVLSVNGKHGSTDSCYMPYYVSQFMLICPF